MGPIYAEKRQSQIADVSFFFQVWLLVVNPKWQWSTSLTIPKATSLTMLLACHFGDRISHDRGGFLSLNTTDRHLWRSQGHTSMGRKSKHMPTVVKNEEK